MENSLFSFSLILLTALVIVQAGRKTDNNANNRSQSELIASTREFRYSVLTNASAYSTFSGLPIKAIKKKTRLSIKGGASHSGENAALTEIINDIHNPCIKSLVDKLISKGISNEISRFINNSFSKNYYFHIQFAGSYNASDHDDAYTTTHLLPSGGVKFTIQFNLNSLAAASQEYIAATIFHEVMHAWADYMYPGFKTAADEHLQMANSMNFNRQVIALKEMFPSLTTQDASDLAWGGLQNTPQWSSLIRAEKDRIVQNIYDFKYHRTGTPCTYY